jgi:hypothetical protein
MHYGIEYDENDGDLYRDRSSEISNNGPQLKTHRGIDLLPTNWMSMAWYIFDLN